MGFSTATTSKAPDDFNSSIITSVFLKEHSSEGDNLQEATSFLKEYYIWIIFAFGFPGNLLSLFVSVRMSRHKLRTPLLYVATLSVVDNTAIVLKIIDKQSHHNIFRMNEIGCQFQFFFVLTFSSFANWILIIMSAERFVAVAFPLRLATIWSFRKAVIVVLVVFFFICGIHIHVFFTATAVRAGCTYKGVYRKFIFKYWYNVSASIFAFIPASCLIICNALIILYHRKSTFFRRNLHSSLKRRNLFSRSNSSGMAAQNQDRQLTIMLVTISIVFIVTTMPNSIFVVLYDIWKPVDNLGIAKKAFVRVLTSFLSDSNHALNFYLYFISGRRFRHYSLRVFTQLSPASSRPISGNHGHIAVRSYLPDTKITTPATISTDL